MQPSIPADGSHIGIGPRVHREVVYPCIPDIVRRKERAAGDTGCRGFCSAVRPQSTRYHTDEQEQTDDRTFFHEIPRVFNKIEIVTTKNLLYYIKFSPFS